MINKCERESKCKLELAGVASFRLKSVMNYYYNIGEKVIH